MPIINSTNHSEMETHDTFIRNAAFSSVTQETGWSYVKNNWEPLYVYLEEEGDIVAAMSVLMVKNIGEKKFAYVSKGPVMNEFSLEYINRLVREAETELKKQQVFLLRMDPEFLYCEEINKSLRAAGFIVRNRELGGKDTIQPRYNMVVNLEGKSEEEVLEGFYSKTRYRIRYAEKKGLESKVSSNRKDLDIFYKLYAMTSERHKISYRPQDYFDRLADAFLDCGRMKIILVFIDGVPDAGGLCFISGRKVWYMYAGSTHENQGLMAPYLVNWEGIRWAIKEKKDGYDFGGVFSLNNEDGLYQFKNGFVRPEPPKEFIGEIDKIYDQKAYKVFLNQEK
ncbi:peptidoglycan bridge formation glycyltransferase FemA/FemB family protein [Enterococcus sp. BWB1-3]|uniref:lipid II:glycine glycyltransferase FemX n=1 Tax=Enterococcus sp. BWB1-3 TaxID=2787713 RepID=UPI0019219B3B|nr:peptidoglycan bridge formation glycyltransferase FemA/FemB family protein [Enterococcus sp. BWB1-3]MBL1230115.1 peptidoglycan bridge formation glycyltransferase FemA/FemB family protein [Enterococcus sp. BWB1-3]